MDNRDISSLIQECRNATEIDHKIVVLRKINSMLPASKQLEIPSLITKTFVDRALDVIDEEL